MLNTGLKFETLIKRSVRMEGVVKRFVQGAEKRNLTLDQYLDLLLNLHGLYDKTVNMHKGIIDNLSSRLEAAESELDAIKNDVGHGE